ncbi:MAG: hypothetical protein S4CHLAM37_14530 [Chlamydiia bacterium]|nr:hypothetical protein [Chlamydiia bacterium]
MTEMFVKYVEGFSTKILGDASQDIVITDTPKQHGGKGEQFSPTDMLAASLGSCVVTMMGIFAKMKNIPFEGVVAKVSKKIKNPATGMVSEITVSIYYPEELDDAKKAILEKAAKNCPVHHALNESVEQKILFYYGETLQGIPSETANLSSV